MQWHGANLNRQDEQPHRLRRSNESRETVEAALNRLSKAYSTSMECVGAWHRSDAAIVAASSSSSSSSCNTASTTTTTTANTDKQQQTVTTVVVVEEQQRQGADEKSLHHSSLLLRVGRAARRTFEESIFSDALVSIHVPAWTHAATAATASVVGSTAAAANNSAAAVQLTSASHKATVKRLAYLSLVNYADLLLAGISSSNHKNQSVASSATHITILDRGVVKSLRSLQGQSDATASSCWISAAAAGDDTTTPSITLEEPEEVTVRLAIAAYLDATALDGSDPTVWLKLACAARRLGRILLFLDNLHNSDDDDDDDVIFAKHRRLERHALECAVTALPRHEPPNRTAVQALREWHAEEETWLLQQQHHQHPDVNEMPEPVQQHLILELPRYSWSTLGRMLLRACKEGNAAYPATNSISTTLAAAVAQNKGKLTKSAPPVLTFSPNVRVRLSPLLVLPTAVLARVVSFLEPAHIWRFEATCRAMSASVISARAVLDNDSEMALRRKHSSRFTAAAAAVSGIIPPPRANNLRQVAQETVVTDVQQERPASQAASSLPSDGSAGEETGCSKRVSKRVRSQIISSGKRAERSSRRNSTEYCLLAATLGCTAENANYQRLLQTSDSSALQGSDSFCGLVPATVPAAQSKQSVGERFASDREDARERLGESSLSSFVESCALRRSLSPLACMFHFVAHASLHISHVFSCDPGGALVISSCLLDCIELMVRRTISGECLVSSWSISCHGVPMDVQLARVELFAIDLLHAELRLRKCDGEEFVSFDFDGDGNFVSTLVPNLLELVEQIDEQVKDRDKTGAWNSLKARCFWLAANFYFWRGRLSCNVGESREAEEEGLKWIDETQKSLQGRGPVPTPHLGSPRRKGLHWKELSVGSLSAFAGEIQASSIVLLAQEQFLEATSKFSGSEADRHLKKEDCEALLSIGESLLARYASEIDAPGAKHAELIDDFLGVHGGKLLATSVGDQQASEDSIMHWFDGLFPTGRVETGEPLFRLPAPCILTILVTCLKTKEEHNPSITMLLVHLVSTLFELSEGISSRLQIQKDRKNRAESSDGFSDSGDDDEEDDSLSGDEEMDRDDGKPSGNADTVRLRQYSTMIRLFLTKICSLCQVEMTAGERSLFAQSSEFTSVLCRSLAFSTEWFHYSRSMEHEVHSIGEDLGTFLAAQALFRAVLPSSGSSEAWVQGLTSLYLSGLFRIVSTQRRVLFTLSQSKPSSNGRSERIRTTRKRADLVAAVCCDAGLLLSQNPSSGASGHMKRSSLFNDPDSNIPLEAHLAMFCDSLLWFWRAASSSDAAGNPTTEKSAADGAHLGSYLDGFGRERLRVPVATAIIGLCGAASSTNRVTVPTKYSDEQISLAEFCDSDCSATEWLSAEDGDEGIDRGSSNEELFRVIMQAVHCVSQIFGKIDEKEACNFPHVKGYLSIFGPCLPLVVTRVLNNFAGYLLVEFRGKGNDAGKSLWSDYPFGTRTVGQLLDSVLCKAYKCLHGFTLFSDAKESAANSSGATSSSKKTHQFLPESKEAAAMLYRCIMRAHSQGRRSPPKAALETVLAALPDIEESEKSVAIRRYLFSVDKSNVEMTGLMSLVAKNASCEAMFADIKGFDWMNDNRADVRDDEAAIVRRGVSSLIAQGPLPRLQDSGDEKEWRSCAAQAEEELYTKFSAVIDDLCFGNTNDCEGWFKASQCLIMKADLIADRLGLSKGFARNRNFYVSERQGLPEASLDLTELESMQEREAQLLDKDWVQCLGNDLSLFVRYSWSSFASLKLCSTEVGRVYTAAHESVSSDEFESNEDDDREMDFDARVWQEINNLYDNKDFVRWQQAWGGLFVSSLRRAAYRCLSVALYVSSIADKTTADKLLRSEITESLGVNLYSELVGSQMYGYPMKAMPVFRKRQIAEAAMACFERAFEVVKPDVQSSAGRVTWDLWFMIGKCREKIANTCQREAFLQSMKGDPVMRRYEHHMSLALNAYATSVAEAKEVEDDGGFIAEQHGGSAHGAVEAVYRLHASRLKCLISAVDRKEDERELAELEALRLTECHWFASLVDECSNLTHRDRVWRVLVDAAGALAKCSLDSSFFHRSVYRHAQALMWAPVLYDPVGERASGSLGTVSATWACKIRGLNYATNAASSATSIMSSLFTKKRPQLVAVWVTGDGTTSAFAAINNTVRKYDSLRGKYIAAYIDCLRLCRRRKELDTFLRWTTATPRDLPSYFAASARAEGGKPTLTHMHDALLVKSHSLASFHFLTTVRREANSALANVILQDVNETSATGVALKTVESAKFFDTQLKLAYACFLRLNCDPCELTKSRAWKYQRKNGAKDVVEALTAAYVKVVKDHPLSGARSDWSGESQLTGIFQAALRKCKELYPSLSGNFSFSRQRAPPKQKSAESAAGSKRKGAAKQVKKSFEVAVPEGMAEGETILTSIEVGGVWRKVRLTVPAGAASTLRFTLQVPTSEEPPPAKKIRIDSP